LQVLDVEDDLGDLDVDGKIIHYCAETGYWGGMDWI
jgi:hypothetical protein